MNIMMWKQFEINVQKGIPVAKERHFPPGLKSFQPREALYR